jgi:hypothetical protein
MKLIQRQNVGHDLHRSGWIAVMDAMRSVATGSGILLDDCPIQTWQFERRRWPYQEPWAAIFHSPIAVRSPCVDDVRASADGTWGRWNFRASLPMFRGGVCMASSLTDYWRRRTHKPCITLRHPTETGVPQWNQGEFLRHPTMLQLGFHLRDLRAIFRVPPCPGWSYIRVAPQHPHHQRRDRTIAAAFQGEVNTLVRDIPRLPNDRYDALLARCVVLTRLFGVAACNVIVECIARGTPLVVDRTPETVEYLGDDYPLYAGEESLDATTLVRASRCLEMRRGPWLEPAYFAAKVRDFCDSLEMSP